MSSEILKPEFCPFRKDKSTNDELFCTEECSLYYRESDSIQGCSIRQIAYYLNWLGNMYKKVNGL